MCNKCLIQRWIVCVAFTCYRDDSYKIPVNQSIEELCGFVRSLSSYQTFRKENPEGSDPVAELSLKYKILLVLCYYFAYLGYFHFMCSKTEIELKVITVIFLSMHFIFHASIFQDLYLKFASIFQDLYLKF